LARAVIQFPVRNAFHVQRSQDALARKPQVDAQRIDGRVQREVERLAIREAGGQLVSFATARGGSLVMMPGRSRQSLGLRIFSVIVRAVLRLARRR
jgi:hypothetical protein